MDNTTLKVYASLPMEGKEDTIVERYNELVKDIKETFPEAEIFGPYNIKKFMNDPTYIRDRDKSYYLGRDFETLNRCNVIALGKGWKGSSGCCAEAEIAVTWGLATYEQV